MNGMATREYSTRTLVDSCDQWKGIRAHRQRSRDRRGHQRQQLLVLPVRLDHGKWRGTTNTAV
jgi:hypothetical protein